MTSADFATRYKLLKRLTESGVMSFNAQQASTGRPVMVHFLDGGATEANQARLLQVPRLDPADRSKIVETIEVDGTSVIVTQFLPGFETLEAWLEPRVQERRASVPPPAPVARPSAPLRWEPPSTIDDAGPTMPMRAIEMPIDRSQRPAAAAPPAPPSFATPPVPPPAAQPAAQPAAPAELEPGEFTRMFRAMSAPASGAERASAPRPVPTPAAPPTPSAPPQPISPLGLSPMRPAPLARPPEPPLARQPEPPRAQPPAPNPASSAPGEFTRVFQGRGTSETPPSASPSFGSSAPLFGSPPPQSSGSGAQMPFGGSSPSLGQDSSPVFPPLGSQRWQPPQPPLDAPGGRVFELALPPVVPSREPAREPTREPVGEPGIDRIIPMSGFQSPPESATGMMSVRAQPPAPPPPVFPIPAPRPPAPIAPPMGAVAPTPVQASGPSEFTRVMKGMAAPVVAASVAVAAGAVHQKAIEKASSEKPSALPVVLALSGVFVAALGLILYIVLRG